MNHIRSVLVFNRNVIVFISFWRYHFYFYIIFVLSISNVLVLVFVKGIITIFVSVFVNVTEITLYEARLSNIFDSSTIHIYGLAQLI